MAKEGSRSMLSRALPALIALLLAMVAAPHTVAAPASSAAPGASASVSASASPGQPAPETSTPAVAPYPVPNVATVDAGLVTDRSVVLSAQSTAGVHGSRAPPVVAA